jgi:Co/Zn/Cd efflux system component
MGNKALSCHIKSRTPMISLKKATRMINTKYKILHTTIQVEQSENDDFNFICETGH